MPKKPTPKKPAVTAQSITTLAGVDDVVKPKPTREEILTAMATLKREALLKEEAGKRAAKDALGKEIEAEITGIVLADKALAKREHQTGWQVYHTGITSLRVEFAIQLGELPASLVAKIQRHDKMSGRMDWQIPPVSEIRKQLRAALLQSDKRVPALLADADARAALQAALDKLDKAA